MANSYHRIRRFVKRYYGYNYAPPDGEDCDVYYLRQTYRNSKGAVFYTEIHKIMVSDRRFFGEYILSRKSQKNYSYYYAYNGLTNYIKHKLKQRFRTGDEKVTLEVVPYSEIEDDCFLSKI